MRSNSRRWRPLFAAVAAVVTAVAASGASAATQESRAYEEVGDGGIVATSWTPLSLSDEPVTVFAELAGDPVTVVQARAGRKLGKAEKAEIENRLSAQQDAVKPDVQRVGGKVLADYQVALNGLKVEIAGNKVDELASLPGVTTVREIALVEPDHTRSVPFIGAPTAWSGAPGLRGEGITVAVIDSGIDYTHANFGGPGTVEAYSSANSADTLPPDPFLVGPAAPKVVDGWDLVGDNYNAAAAATATPQPDPNPLDCNTGNAGGHGTHVAGSVAGFGVTSSGTYGGPWSDSTFASNAFVIGPGVAPAAKIIALRVFGCSGSTGVTVDAIEMAVDKGADVINMSLGSAFGSAEDATAVAASNAAAAGVIVVASAGNSGASQYITGSPSSGTGAIAVAANDSWQSTPGVRVQTSPPSGSALDLNGINANGHEFSGPLNGPLVVLQDNPATTTDQAGYIGSADESQGCSPASYAFNGVTAGGNQIAVARRGTCARVAKAIFGQQAGAAAVVMTNNAAGLPPFEGAITSNPDTGEQYTVTIPFVGVAGNQDAAGTDSSRLRASPSGTTGTLSPIALTNPNYKGFASFTSGGPRRNDSWLKPDITGPGVSIVSAGVGTGNGIRISSGTSMSGPHVAGVAALTRQAHPTWSVEDIKAAIVNTGDPSGVGNAANPFRISRGGSGLVQPAKAAKTSVVAVGDPMTATLNYGFAEFTTDYSATKTVTLRNHGASAASFDVSTAGNAPFTSPHTATPSASSVVVPAGGTATVDVTLSATGAAVGGTNAFKEIAGAVVFTPTGGSNDGVSLRVPYYLVPRPNARIKTAPGQLRFSGDTTTRSVNVVNQDGQVSGTGDFYLWGLEDGNEANANANDVRAVGAQSFAAPITGDADRRFLVFAVSTHDRWSNAAVSEFDIAVDVDGDNTTDYIVAVADAGLLLGTGAFDGRMAVGVFSTRSPGASVAFLATAPHDSGVLLAPVRIWSSAAGGRQLCRPGEPCLSAANPRLTYSITGFALRSGSANDTVAGAAAFNAWSSSLSQGMFTGSLAPGASVEVPVTLDRTEWAQTPAKGVMVVSTENKSGAGEAALVPVTVSP